MIVLSTMREVDCCFKRINECIYYQGLSIKHSDGIRVGMTQTESFTFGYQRNNKGSITNSKMSQNHHRFNVYNRCSL